MAPRSPHHPCGQNINSMRFSVARILLFLMIMVVMVMLMLLMTMMIVVVMKLMTIQVTMTMQIVDMTSGGLVDNERRHQLKKRLEGSSKRTGHLSTRFPCVQIHQV